MAAIISREAPKYGCASLNTVRLIANERTAQKGHFRIVATASADGALPVIRVS
jgi:hypothetical protein